MTNPRTLAEDVSLVEVKATDIRIADVLVVRSSSGHHLRTVVDRDTCAATRDCIFYLTNEEGDPRSNLLVSPAVFLLTVRR